MASVRRRTCALVAFAVASMALVACGAAPGARPGRRPSSAVANRLADLASVTGPTGPRTVALTFDDGPNPASTPQILDILDRFGVKATFFVVGRNVAQYPDLAREIVRRGHSIANHTWDHANLTRVSGPQIDAQIQRTDDVIVRTTGRRPTCVRPPYGALNRTVANRIAASDHLPVLWTVDPTDWKRPGAGAIVDRILRASRPDGIVLMHDGGGDRCQTVAALPSVIQGLRDAGYDFAATCIPVDLTAPPTTAPTTAPPTTAAPAPVPTDPPTTVPTPSTTSSTTTTTAA